jgi:hypothetical protein
VRFDRDVEIPMRDGVILRANVFRPEGDARVPIILSAHPYGKDALPRRSLFGYRAPMMYRIMRQPSRTQISAWTSWEAPDPAFWVSQGYAVVNLDLRGFFRSDGTGCVMSREQGRDVHDAIEWLAVQPWCTGRVGMCGVSYLAITQWLAAAERPPHLAAICPWEGLTDAYRDLAYPGGVREDGFVPFWSKQVNAEPRNRDDLRAEQLARPLIDDWWRDRASALEQIDVPLLVCGSFSDHNLHTNGSFDGFARVRSQHKWLYTHRDGKWVAFYGAEARAFQARFFACFLKDEDNGMRDVPPIRLEVRDTGDAVAEIRGEREWPLARTQWTSLYLHADGTLGEKPAAAAAEISYDCARGTATFRWKVERDLELTGPMMLRLHVEARGVDDLLLFAGVRKSRAGRELTFEGSFGFGRDLVTRGWLRASHRTLDPHRSTPYRPVHAHDRVDKLSSGEIVPVDLALLPSATTFRANDIVQLDIQGRYFFRRNPLVGQFPTGYEASTAGTAVLHIGGRYDAHLSVPIV